VLIPNSVNVLVFFENLVLFFFDVDVCNLGFEMIFIRLDSRFGRVGKSICGVVPL